MKPGIILSMEQALSMTYATLRFVQLGWRVIKVESTPQRPGALPGDPNRYIGSVVADEDRRSYFVGPNLGKEAIAMNLKSDEGQEALRRIICELDVDVCCCAVHRVEKLILAMCFIFTQDCWSELPGSTPMKWKS